jgi:hypothetical protein
MSKRAKHVKVLKTKDTRIEVVLTPGKPDYIYIFTQRDAMIEMAYPGMPKPKPAAKDKIPFSGGELKKFIEKVVEAGSSWAAAAEQISNIGKTPPPSVGIKP